MNPFDWSPAMIHSIVMHFPVALAFLGIPVVCLGFVGDPERNGFRWLAAVAYLLLVGFAFLAVETGATAEAELPDTIPQEIQEEVDRYGQLWEPVWILAGATAILLLLSIMRFSWLRKLTMFLALIVSLVTAGWVGVTAHQGHVLVYEYGLGTPAMDELYTEEAEEVEESEEPGEPPEIPEEEVEESEEPVEPGGLLELPEEPEEPTDPVEPPELPDMEGESIEPVEEPEEEPEVEIEIEEPVEEEPLEEQEEEPAEVPEEAEDEEEEEEPADAMEEAEDTA
ncbi:MAG: DUF2231 domain-containing protein [Candidatus Hydrogenedentota bacterium]